MAYKPKILAAVDGGTGQQVYAIGDILYASSTTALSKLPIGSNTQVLTLTAGVPTWAAPATSGTVTSVSGTTNRITSTGGAAPVIDISASYVGQSSITTLGTITTGVWTGTNIALANGGTNAGLTASNGGIFYSTATAGAILSGTATANKVLMSGASTTPTWSTPTYPNASATSGKVIISDGTNFVSSTPTFPNSASGTGTILRADGTNWVASTSTYPDTNAINTLLYASSANIMSALATGNNGALITSSGGVPSISSTLPSTVQGNITSVGTVASGTWNGTAIDVAHGGTGNATQPAYSLVCGGTTTTGAFQSVADVATGSVLISGGTGALPSFSATPTVTSITFGAGTALSTYAEGTWTATWTGASTAGSTNYSNQNGYYTKVGNYVFCQYTLVVNSATGTGNINVGGLPFTIKNQTRGDIVGCVWLNNAITWPASRTACVLYSAANSTNLSIQGMGTGQNGGAFQMSNNGQTCVGNVTYQV